MKTLLLGTCLIFSAIIVQAQEFYRPVTAGVRAGANLSGVIQDGISKNNPELGATGGLVMNFQIAKKHAIDIEALLTSRNFTQPDQNVKNSMVYVDMPVLYKHTFYSGKKVGNVTERLKKGHFYFQAGPQLSLLLSSKARYLTPEPASTNEAPTDLYALTRPFDLSAVAGFGYQLKSGLSFDTRYALGLRQINGATTAFIPNDALSSSVQIGISYLIPVHF